MTDKPAVDLYSAEFGDSLTGFEEIAISRAFGESIDALGAQGGMIGVRALVFAHRRREGDDDKTAKAHAMDLTRGAVADYFAGIGARPMESEAEEGKG